MTLPQGVWPAMITPLNEDKSIYWPGVDALTDWYIEAGVAGLFAVGQSSEMFALDDQERLALAKRVVDRVAGRVPVVATGTFGGPIAQQADFVKQMVDTGVQAVTIIASAMADDHENDDVWQGNLEQLLALTGDIPLSLYECPQPYHRLIPPERIGWAAQTGRFMLLKDTSRSLEAVRAKVKAAKDTPLGIYNADTTGLLASLRAGASGYCGIAANLYPELVVWLCNHADDDRAEQVHAVISTVDPVIHHKYPVCAKYYRQHTGFDMLTISRVSDAVMDDYDRRVFDAIAVQMAFTRAWLGL